MKISSTKDVVTSKRKVLLYANAGYGKTTQMKYFQEAYGPGLILSGESGLSSIRSADIDFITFDSWSGESDPDKGMYSLKDIWAFIRSPEFAKHNYQWIGVDSLTELSDLSFQHAEQEQILLAERVKKKVDSFAVWGSHAAQLIGACKAVRDLPLHVIMTALTKETTDENGATTYWPMVAGRQAQVHLPGIFDAVFAGVRRTVDEGQERVVERFLVTDEVRGYIAKVRDEHRRLKPVERSSNVVELLARLDMNEKEWADFQAEKR
jgi:hypothetical protein